MNKGENPRPGKLHRCVNVIKTVLCYSWRGKISWSVCPWQALPALAHKNLK